MRRMVTGYVLADEDRVLLRRLDAERFAALNRDDARRAQKLRALGLVDSRVAVRQRTWHLTEFGRSMVRPLEAVEASVSLPEGLVVR